MNEEPAKRHEVNDWAIRPEYLRPDGQVLWAIMQRLELNEDDRDDPENWQTLTCFGPVFARDLADLRDAITATIGVAE